MNFYLFFSNLFALFYCLVWPVPEFSFIDNCTQTWFIRSEFCWFFFLFFFWLLLLIYKLCLATCLSFKFNLFIVTPVSKKRNFYLKFLLYSNINKKNKKKWIKAACGVFPIGDSSLKNVCYFRKKVSFLFILVELITHFWKWNVKSKVFIFEYL